MLESRVFSLSLLSDDDAVDILVSAVYIWQGLDMHHVSVQVQRVTKLHVKSLQFPGVGEIWSCQDTLKITS